MYVSSRSFDPLTRFAILFLPRFLPLIPIDFYRSRHLTFEIYLPVMRLTIPFLSRTTGRTPPSTASNPSNCRRTNEDDFTRHHFVSKQRWTVSVRSALSYHPLVIE